MTQQLKLTNQKIKIYEYFGVEVFFMASDFQALVVYGEFQDKLSKIMIHLENGVYSHISVLKVEGYEPLEEKELEKFAKLVGYNLSEIIRSWIDNFVYHKQISFEKILKPIL